MVEPQQLRDQPFRIYRVVPELTKITVYARHIFYDLLDNMIQSVKPASSTVGASVIQTIASSCLSEHGFAFYSDLDSTAEEVALENMNPVDAILGSDGVVEKYGGKLARDWFDVYLVKRVGRDTNVQIREGKNLLGITYDLDLTDVVTRIMPTGEDADGNVLYLPELFIDSPLIVGYRMLLLEISISRPCAADCSARESPAQTAAAAAVRQQNDTNLSSEKVDKRAKFCYSLSNEVYQVFPPHSPPWKDVLCIEGNF